MSKRLITVLLALLPCFSGFSFSISRLSVDFISDAPGVQIRSAHPALGWTFADARPGMMQRAYRVLVASSPALLEEGSADVWDSGKVRGSSSVSVRLDAALEASRTYWWTVRAWDNRGCCSDWAAPASFTTAAVLDNVQARYCLVKSDEQPSRVANLAGKVTLVDFGRDAYAQASVTVRSEADDTLTVHFGEALDGNGRILRNPAPSSIRYSRYTIPVKAGEHTCDIAIRPDGRNSTIVPGRSYNPVLMPSQIGEVTPFRYVEVEWGGESTEIPGIIRHTVTYPFDDNASDFRCSDEVLNRVWDLCKYSIKATTALGVYIDGDRERIPYEADALINQLGHYCTDREYALARYSVDYLCRNATWPTEWIMQAALMCWNDYMATGDPRLLEKNYDILKARTLVGLRDSTGLISTRTGLQSADLMRSIGYAGSQIRDIVDWPQSGACGVEKAEGGEADGFVMSTYNCVVNAYHYRNLVLMGKIAGVLGRESEAAEWKADAETFRKLFNDKFFDAAAGRYIDGLDAQGKPVGLDPDGKSVGHSALHSNMFALDFGLVPRSETGRVVSYIKSRGMACSVFGAQFLLESLYGAGEDDYALSLLAGTGLRSWYNMIRRGSTITLEAWDDVFKPNLDWNHAWGAAPANIIPMYLMGITPVEPGCSRISVRPLLGSLDSAFVRVPTIRGAVSVSARRLSGGKTEISVELPANMTADIYLPSGRKKTVRRSTVVTGNSLRREPCKD
ncbi:MAG: family 78 glycoside hydrolase catalytic domain [Bacteroidales bacterium]|nr:family 78 glycoside hydrolase catalytic domain [Bacteroidales bacterium]